MFWCLNFVGISISCMVVQIIGAPSKNYILDISIDCGASEKANKPTLNILTDVAIKASAKCKGGDKLFLTDDFVHYNLPASLKADKLCQLHQRENSDNYAIELMVQYGEVGSLILTKKKILTAVCTFSQHGKDETPQHAIIDGPLAPIEMQSIIGNAIPSKELKLSIQTVDDKDVAGNLNLDRKYSIYGVYTGKRKGVGFKPVSCDALSKAGERYAILRAGCGDGMIFTRTSGFVTTGTTFRSPYFEAFHLGKSADLSFDCNVTLCNGGCDGSSCETVCGTIGHSITNGKLSACKGNDELKDTCLFNCDAGYNKQGDGISTCGADGIWTRPKIKCVAKDCGKPIAVVSAKVTAAKTTYPNSASYSCDPGYEKATGSLAVSCLATGKWGARPTCSAKDCGKAIAVVRAKVVATKTTYPSRATYTCNSGYEKATGSLSVACLATGKWGARPTCTAKDCGKAVAVVNAKFPPTKTTYPSRVTYTCDPGYERATGSMTVSCLATGKWGALPTCKAKDCGKAVAVVNAKFPPTKTTYSSRVTYICDPGYERATGSLSVSCLASGKWGARPTCKAKDCGKAVAVVNAKFPPTKTTYPSRVTYTCDPGYEKATGSLAVSCLASGKWGARPTCKAKDCGRPIDVGNAKFPATKTTYPSRVTYTCDPGYKRATGSLSVACLANGKWGARPTCKAKDCGTPIAVSDAKVLVAKTTYSSSVTYTCNSGYKRATGSLTVTCLATGKWGSRPTCKAKDCGTPIAVGNAKFLAPKTTYPSRATYTCDPGYMKATGSLVVSCLATGKWGALPTCKVQNCGKAPSVRNGRFIYQSKIRTVYRCNTFYKMRGSATIICRQNGIWTSAPRCNHIFG